MSSPRRRWTAGVAAGVAIALVALGVVLWRERRSTPPAALPHFEVVDPSVEDHLLLQDALDITAWRSSGLATNFSYVPAVRPPHLSRMSIGGGGAAVLDSYRFSTPDLFVIVAFSNGPTTDCADRRELGWVCLRDGPLAVTAGQGPGLPTHVTAYATGANGGSPDLESQAAKDLREFWRTTELVPLARAAWFSSLVERARVAAK